MNDEFGSIIEPSPVTFSFEAPGWTYLMIILGMVAIGIALRWAIIYFRNSYRRRAIEQLSNLNDGGQINVILKALALRSFERDQVAGLHGEAWIEFLLSKLKTHSFSQKELSDTISKIWEVRAVSSDELQRFRQFSSFWIKHYHV